MIRKLMTSTAVLALLSAGAVNLAMAQDATNDSANPATQSDTMNATGSDSTTAPDATKPDTAATDTTKTDTDATAASADQKLVPEKPTVASAFMGRSVYSSNDPESETIGDVNDLIIDENGEITSAVVGVGGFLGIGQKNVAVPFDELQVVERDGEIRLIYAATREQLEAAPAVDMAQYDPAVRYAEQQQATNATAPAGGLAPAPAPAGGMAAAPVPAPAPDQTADNAATPPAGSDTATPPASNDMAANEAPADQGDQAADATADQNAVADQTADQNNADQTAAANNNAATDGNSFMSAEPGQIRASTLIGKAVYSGDDNVGDVNDIVLDKQGGTRVALIDVGGFLGVGEKTVAVPFDQLKFAKSDGSNEPRVTIAMDRSALEQLPTYEKPEVNTAATDTTAAPAGGMAPAPAPAPSGDMAAAPSDNAATGQPADQMTTGAIDSDFNPQEVAASDLMGTRVYGSNDADLGEIGDIVFDESGNIDAVIVDVGGFLGIGEKPVALNFDSLNIRTDQSGTLMVSVNTTEDQLKQAPAYEETAAQ